MTWKAVACVLAAALCFASIVFIGMAIGFVSTAKERAMTESTEACQHRMRTYKSIIVGEFRKRYRRCSKCQHHDSILVPMDFSYLKFDVNTKVGIESIDSIAAPPTLN
jgi:hypothetical protein